MDLDKSSDEEVFRLLYVVDAPDGEEVVKCSRCHVRTKSFTSGTFDELEDVFWMAGWNFDGYVLALCPRCDYDHFASRCIDIYCECDPRPAYLCADEAALPRRMPSEDWMWRQGDDEDEEVIEVFASERPAEPVSTVLVRRQQPRRKRAKRRRR